jgi:glycosyltransferase involved in cell wall biosynthesis
MRILMPPEARIARAARPIRVCYLIDELATAGTETQLLALIRHLDRRRVEPILCLLRGDNPVSRALEPDDCPVFRLGVGSLRSPSTLVKAWRFTRLLRRERVDVLQVYFPDSTYFGLALARWAGVPHRLRTRNNLGYWRTPLHRFLGRLMHGYATGTLANCEAARKSLLDEEPVAPESVVVLENGVDLNRFLAVPVPMTLRPRCIGAVANLRPIKGVDVFLEAAADVTAAHPELVFVVAGEGEQRAFLRQRAQERGLGERFRLCGSVSDVPAFLAGVDVAVQPSRSEGMSNALLEYMAAGRPIVATSVGAAPELIEDGKHGLLVAPDDPEALASAIVWLVNNPMLGRALGSAARERARRHYSREAMVKRFEDYYESLMGFSRAPDQLREVA